MFSCESYIIFICHFQTAVQEGCGHTHDCVVALKISKEENKTNKYVATKPFSLQPKVTIFLEVCMCYPKWQSSVPISSSWFFISLPGEFIGGRRTGLRIHYKSEQTEATEVTVVWIDNNYQKYKHLDKINNSCNAGNVKKDRTFYLKAGKYLLFRMNTTLSWRSAQNTCFRNSGNLPMFSSRAEHNEFLALMKYGDPYLASIFIGLQTRSVNKQVFSTKQMFFSMFCTFHSLFDHLPVCLCRQHGSGMALHPRYLWDFNSSASLTEQAEECYGNQNTIPKEFNAQEETPIFKD